MLDILKNRLPDGLEIVKTKNKTGASQIQIWFSYDGVEVVGWLQKMCAPKMEESNCDFTICNAMINIALKKNDMGMADYWLKKSRESFGVDK